MVKGPKILHGVSYRWRYSADGKEFKGEDHFGGLPRAATPGPDTVTLIGDPEQKVPTAGDIFVVLRFGAMIAGLGILSRFGYSMLMDGMWVHNKLEDEPEPPPGSGSEPGSETLPPDKPAEK